MEKKKYRFKEQYKDSKIVMPSQRLSITSDSLTNKEARMLLEHPVYYSWVEEIAPAIKTVIKKKEAVSSTEEPEKGRKKKK